jgi:hypothetical protein
MLGANALESGIGGSGAGGSGRVIGDGVVMATGGPLGIGNGNGC